MHGIRGSPERSNDRFINKVFDHKRTNQLSLNGCVGCDIEYNCRESVMGVGVPPVGGLKSQREEVAQEAYVILNIDRSSKLEQ